MEVQRGQQRQPAQRPVQGELADPAPLEHHTRRSPHRAERQWPESTAGSVPAGGLSDWRNGFAIDLSPWLHQGDNQLDFTVDNYYLTGGIALRPLAGWRVLLLARGQLPLCSPCRDVLSAAKNLLLIGCYGAATPWTLRNHDVGYYGETGHLAYVGYVAEHLALPRPDRGWEYFQPPLYYVAGALVWRWAQWLNLSVPEALQALALVFWLVFLVASAATLRLGLRRSPAMLALATAALALAAQRHHARPAPGQRSAAVRSRRCGDLVHGALVALRTLPPCIRHGPCDCRGPIVQDQRRHLAPDRSGPADPAPAQFPQSRPRLDSGRGKLCHHGGRRAARSGSWPVVLVARADPQLADRQHQLARSQPGRAQAGAQKIPQAPRHSFPDQPTGGHAQRRQRSRQRLEFPAALLPDRRVQFRWCAETLDRPGLGCPAVVVAGPVVGCAWSRSRCSRRYGARCR